MWLMMAGDGSQSWFMVNYKGQYPTKQGNKLMLPLWLLFLWLTISLFVLELLMLKHNMDVDMANA